jgi:hypothetical protein
MMPDFVRLAGIADFLVWGVPPPFFMEVHEYQCGYYRCLAVYCESALLASFA